MLTKKKNQLHVVALPYPAQGHIHPMMSLCKDLVRKGCKVTFVNTQSNHDRIINSFHKKDANWEQNNATLRGQRLGIELVSIVGGPPPELHAESESLGAVFDSINALERPFGELVEKLISSKEEEEEGPHFILSDVFMSWSRLVAEKHGMPYVAFATCSLAANATFVNMDEIIQEAFLPNHDKKRNGVLYIGDEKTLVTSAPGLPPMYPSAMAFALTNSEVVDSSYHMAKSCYGRLSGLSWILVNSFMELEKSVFEGLSEHGTQMQPIGPLIPSMLSHLEDKEEKYKDYENDSMVSSLWEEDATCMEWLDGKEEGSVLYISFGSIVKLPRKQLEELALGIEASQQTFLWVARDNFVNGHRGGPSPFPLGFRERTHAHGLFVKWCPQIKVLSHKAIGGFLTHCGWNSTLESISMGVPLLCWPADLGERRTNARFVVDIWKVGFEFQHGNDYWVSKEEVERVVRFLTHEKHGHNVRQQAIRLSQAARKAREENGSSSRTLDLLIEDMKQKAFHD